MNTQILAFAFTLLFVGHSNAWAHQHNQNQFDMKANGYQDEVTGNLMVKVTAKIQVRESSTSHTYSKVAYKLFCPHSSTAQIYIHEIEKFTFSSQVWQFKIEMSHQNDAQEFEQGYPMTEELQWLNTQPATTTQSTCKLEYQGITVFSRSPIPPAIAAQIRFYRLDPQEIQSSAAIKYYPFNHRSEQKSHLIDIHRTTTD